MNKLIVVKLHCKLRFKYKKKRYRIFNTEISNDTVFFFLNLKDKKKLIIRLLLCLRRLSVRYLNLNELQI